MHPADRRRRRHARACGRSPGAEASTCSGPKTASKAKPWRCNTPHLVLLDLMLPKVDGLTLCQRLRRDERTSRIPVLMLTALGSTKDKVSGFNSGADDYLAKPFDLEELLVRIKALLRRSDRAPLDEAQRNPQLRLPDLGPGALRSDLVRRTRPADPPGVRASSLPPAAPRPNRCPP